MLAVVAATMAALALAAGPADSTSASAPLASAEAKAEAIAKPSVVYLQTRWRGYVHIPPNSVHVREEWVGPYEATTSCSGFVANSAGYVVTAGHCVDNVSMTTGGKAAIIEVMLNRAVAGGVLTRTEASVLQNQVRTNGVVEGSEGGSPPARRVTVYEPAAAVGSPGNGMVAQVVEYRGLSQGDVALLKVRSATPMPALAVATRVPDTGTRVMSAGYPGSAVQATGATLEPSFNPGAISSTRTFNGVPFTEVSAASSHGMSGGPTFDLRGVVCGTVSFGRVGGTRPVSFITGTATLRSLLARHGVPLTLSDADRAYRTGLDDYYAGRYHHAVAEFDKVLAAQPGQSTARRLRARAIANYPLEPTGPSPWVYVGIGAGVAVVATAALLIIWRRRRTGARRIWTGGERDREADGRAAPG